MIWETNLEEHRMDVSLFASVGLDLGKTTFRLVALDCHAKVILRKKFLRAQLLAFTANLPWSINRDGSLLRCTFLRRQTARSRKRGETHPGAVCEAIRTTVESRRLHSLTASFAQDTSW